MNRGVGDVARLALPGLFAAIWPFASFYAANVLTGLSFPDLGAYAVVSACGLLLLVLLCQLLIPRSWRPGFCLGIAVGFIFLFLYGTVGDALSAVLSEPPVNFNQIRFAIWAAVTAVATFAAIWFGRRAEVFLSVTVGLGVMVFFAAGEIVLSKLQLGRAGGQPELAATNAEATGSALKKKHNIYSFVLDTYVRSDVLQDRFGYDNRAFEQNLRQRGFSIGTRSLSNYPWTSLSVASSLSMAYSVKAGPAEPHDSLKASWKISGFNPVVARLKEAGYQYVLFHGGRYQSTLSCTGLEDHCLRCEGILTETDILLLDKTPFAHLLRRFATRVFNTFSGECRLADLNAKLDRLKGKRVFLFAHLMALHDPMNVDSDCNPLNQPVPEKWLPVGQSRLLDMQIDCLNKEVLTMVDDLVKVDPDAIILLTGDHGVWPDCKNCEEDSAARLMRHAIFTAMRLPPQCQQHFTPEITPVNHYRLVMACLENRTPRLLENHFYSVKALEPGNPKTDLRVIEWSEEELLQR